MQHWAYGISQGHNIVQYRHSMPLQWSKVATKYVYPYAQTQFRIASLSQSTAKTQGCRSNSFSSYFFFGFGNDSFSLLIRVLYYRVVLLQTAFQDVAV